MARPTTRAASKAAIHHPELGSSNAQTPRPANARHTKLSPNGKPRNQYAGIDRRRTAKPGVRKLAQMAKKGRTRDSDKSEPRATTYAPEEVMSTALSTKQELDQTVSPPVERLYSNPGWSSSTKSLWFVEASELEADEDTIIMTLNLIDLTLLEADWHSGLLGMVQPLACFLFASLLTGKSIRLEQLLATYRDIEADQLLYGYALLYEWRANLAEVVGGYAGGLECLPLPEELYDAQLPCEDELYDWSVDETA